MDHLDELALLVAQDYAMLCLKQLSPEEYIERCNQIQERVEPEYVPEFLKRLPDALDAGAGVAMAKLALAEETDNAHDALYVPMDRMRWPASLIEAAQKDPVLRARLDGPPPTLQ